MNEWTLSKWVSFESRKGMCPDFPPPLCFARALMQFPRALKDLLIIFASSRTCPAAPVFPTWRKFSNEANNVDRNSNLFRSCKINQIQSSCSCCSTIVDLQCQNQNTVRARRSLERRSWSIFNERVNFIHLGAGNFSVRASKFNEVIDIFLIGNVLEG